MLSLPTHRRPIGIVVVAALAATLVFAGAMPSASAEPDRRGDVNVRRARQHFLSGKKAFEAKDYPEALREFQAGYELEPRPGFLLNMAHAARKMGDLQHARDLFRRFLATDPSGEERRAAEQSVAEIERMMAPQPETPVVPLPGASGSPSGAGPGGAVATAPNPGTNAGTEATSPGEVSGSMGGAPSLPSLSATQQQSGGAMVVAPLPPPAPPTEEDRPLYKKWWFWTGLAAVAAGTAAILILGAGNSDEARGSGTWGEIRL